MSTKLAITSKQSIAKESGIEGFMERPLARLNKRRYSGKNTQAAAAASDGKRAKEESIAKDSGIEGFMERPLARLNKPRYARKNTQAAAAASDDKRAKEAPDSSRKRKEGFPSTKVPSYTSIEKEERTLDLSLPPENQSGKSLLVSQKRKRRSEFPDPATVDLLQLANFCTEVFTHLASLKDSHKLCGVTMESLRKERNIAKKDLETAMSAISAKGIIIENLQAERNKFLLTTIRLSRERNLLFAARNALAAGKQKSDNDNERLIARFHEAADNSEEFKEELETLEKKHEEAMRLLKENNIPWKEEVTDIVDEEVLDEMSVENENDTVALILLALRQIVHLH